MRRTIQVETFSFFSVQANARLVIEQPKLSAISVSFLTFSIFSLPAAELSALISPDMAPELVWYREPSGMPLLYLPVSMPESRGDQMVLWQVSTNALPLICGMD